MNQTPPNNVANEHVVALIPKDAKKIIEIGCSWGSIAREYKKINPKSYFIGCEIVPAFAERARLVCDEVRILDIDRVKQNWFDEHSNCDTWVFADVLEHLRDPWQLIGNIRKVIPENGCIIACIPNAQHWSTIARLVTGNFRYTDQGLMDRTHIRWFTRKTIIEMFHQNGFNISDVICRYSTSRDNEMERAGLLERICQVTNLYDIDSKETINDILPFQYVVRARPISGLRS
jgi:2-polyprenyl-3-methyl-5-hydroxy-6-metoxy-1,4-benzoquinol methylase